MGTEIFTFKYKLIFPIFLLIKTIVDIPTSKSETNTYDKKIYKNNILIIIKIIMKPAPTTPPSETTCHSPSSTVLSAVPIRSLASCRSASSCIFCILSFSASFSSGVRAFSLSSASFFLLSFSSICFAYQGREKKEKIWRGGSWDIQRSGQIYTHIETLPALVWEVLEEVGMWRAYKKKYTNVEKKKQNHKCRKKRKKSVITIILKNIATDE